MNHKLLSMMMAISLGAGAAQLATAQNDRGTAQTPPSAEARISDSDLALFRKASNSVSEVRQEYQRELQQAEDMEQAQALQEEASQRMVETVQSFGMTIDEYNQIATAVQSDPKAMERLNEMADS